MSWAPPHTTDSNRPDPTSGQAFVEAALTLPLWIALFLCTLQLALLAQARLLTEYAAYQAARAGIVWGGDPEKMQDAAAFVLAPTACPTRHPAGAMLCRAAAASEVPALRQAAAMAAIHGLSADPALGFPGAHVYLLNPHWPTHHHLFDRSGTLAFDRFDTEADERRDATLLTIQLLHWFELKIPFADRILWSAWIAARKGGALFGGTPAIPAGDELHRGPDNPWVSEGAWAAMRGAAAGAGTHFLPVVAHHTMRMQSDVSARFLRGCACAQGDGCTSTCKAW